MPRVAPGGAVQASTYPTPSVTSDRGSYPAPRGWKQEINLGLQWSVGHGSPRHLQPGFFESADSQAGLSGSDSPAAAWGAHP